MAAPPRIEQHRRAAVWAREESPERVSLRAPVREVGREPTEQPAAPEDDVRREGAEAATHRRESELRLGRVAGAQRAQVLAVSKDELEPSHRGRVLPTHAEPLLLGQRLVAGRARELDRLVPRAAELLGAAEGEELCHARRVLGRARLLHALASLALGGATAGAAAVQLLEHVGDDVQVARDDEHLHVGIDVDAHRVQDRDENVPVVEASDRRVQLLDRVQAQLAVVRERAEQQGDAHSVGKVRCRRLRERDLRAVVCRPLALVVVQQPQSLEPGRYRGAHVHPTDRRPASLEPGPGFELLGLRNVLRVGGSPGT